jgi:pSer/pThr/pTyr-binding forkhead associated (FHA) protein
MIHLKVLSGKKAGSQSVVRHFPFSVGRAVGNNLQLDDAGVWDQHFTLECNRDEGFNLALATDALAAVNNQSVQTARLRNGDVISFGSVKLQFWLAPPRQRGLFLSELFVWTLLVAVTAGQFALIYLLLR